MKTTLTASLDGVRELLKDEEQWALWHHAQAILVFFLQINNSVIETPVIPRKSTDLWNPWWLWHLYSHSGLKTTTLIFMLSHHLILSQHNIIYVLLKGKKILPSFDSFSPLKPRHVKFTFYSLSILLVINEKYEVFQLLFLSLFYFFFFQ